MQYTFAKEVKPNRSDAVAGMALQSPPKAKPMINDNTYRDCNGAPASSAAVLAVMIALESTTNVGRGIVDLCR